VDTEDVEEEMDVVDLEWEVGVELDCDAEDEVVELSETTFTLPFIRDGWIAQW